MYRIRFDHDLPGATPEDPVVREEYNELTELVIVRDGVLSGYHDAGDDAADVNGIVTINQDWWDDPNRATAVAVHAADLYHDRDLEAVVSAERPDPTA